jgi:hypothetical protein
MNTISARRVAGFIVLAIVIVIGTIGFGFAVSSCQPAGPPSATELLLPSDPPSAVASDVPAPGGTIPPFVPVPTGPAP